MSERHRVVSERHRRFAILEAALDTPSAQRWAKVEEMCAGDVALAEEIRAMLELEADADAAFTAPVLDLHAIAEGSSPVGAELELSSRLGAYRIVELLGRGGMGAVYRAVREDDFQKQVAIKLIRSDLLASTVQRRFHVERQILARFEHPSIARLLDGGTTAEGQPFLVMEYVEGVPIDTYCAHHGLGIRQRVELFQKVLPAVAYSHRNMVVHRDLKPGNILVTEHGIPRLVDFGIAKLLDDRDSLTASTTLAGYSPLTPHYASPEQLQEMPATTASDVFSLGVLFYKLLTGRHPWWREGMSLLDLALDICEVEAVPPSSILAPDDTGATPRERRRHRRALAGDLDAIVLKALHKDPSSRYAGVEDLERDLQRYRKGLPVRARQGTWAYRTGRRLRRFKGLLAMALAILVFAIVSTVLWRRAEGERRRADHERAEAVAASVREEQVAEFLQELFQAVDPNRAGGHGVSVSDLLEVGRQRLAAGLVDDPRLVAELSGTLGRAYRDLGLYEEALELLDRSVAQLQKLEAPGLELADALEDLASVHRSLGELEEAERLQRRALEIRHDRSHETKDRGEKP